MNLAGALLTLEEDGEHFWFDGTVITLKATGKDTAGRFLIFDCITPRKKNDLHVHHDADEMFLIVDGDVLVRTPDGEHAGSAGTMGVVPRGVAHAVEATSPTARILALLTPASVATEAYIREIGEPTDTRNLPPLPTPESIERMRAAAARYELSVASGDQVQSA